METGNVLNQMAKFDFNAPIHVEITFEDSDGDDSSMQNELNEQENTKDNNNNKEFETKCKNDEKSSKINHRGLNKAILSLNKTNRILKEKPIESENNAEKDLNNLINADIGMNKSDVGHHLNQSESAADQCVLILNGNFAVNNEESLPSTRRINDHSEPATTFVEDLLQNLSGHIVLIMQSFYHYGLRNSSQDNKKREEIFHFIKKHFFELSYNTVESIILPQEQNNSFIDTFLDNTVILANSKSQRWKCQKRHVQPFFQELVTWTKQRREQIKVNHPPCPSNENITLKQQLSRPPLPFNLPRSGIVANSIITTPNTPNLCIFTSGTPGQEISININADTLLQYTDSQQLITVERNENYNNHPPSSESTRRNATVTRPTYGNRVHDIQQNNSHNRPPPPPYHKNHCSKILPHRHTTQKYNQKNMNPSRNNHSNMRQIQQNHQYIGQPMFNYQTQVQYNNTRQIPPSYNDSSNYMLYDSTNNIPMHETQMEHQTTSSPIITNVTSLNPGPHILNIRCFMCGKNTSTPCAYYNPTKTYCSYLCKELDSQFYKRAYGNT